MQGVEVAFLEGLQPCQYKDNYGVLGQMHHKYCNAFVALETAMVDAHRSFQLLLARVLIAWI